jgi:hypothetical protein
VRALRLMHMALLLKLCQAAASVMPTAPTSLAVANLAAGGRASTLTIEGAMTNV